MQEVGLGQQQPVSGVSTGVRVHDVKQRGLGWRRMHGCRRSWLTCCGYGGRALEERGPGGEAKTCIKAPLRTQTHSGVSPGPLCRCGWPGPQTRSCPANVRVCSKSKGVVASATAFRCLVGSPDARERGSSPRGLLSTPPATHPPSPLHQHQHRHPAAQPAALRCKVVHALTHDQTHDQAHTFDRRAERQNTHTPALHCCATTHTEMPEPLPRDMPRPSHMTLRAQAQAQALT